MLGQGRRALPVAASLALSLLSACGVDHLIGSAGFVASRSFFPQLAGLQHPVLSTGDLDGDQRDDVAILDAASGRLCLLWNDGDAWSAPLCQTLPVDDATNQVAVARLVPDGRAQLVLLGRDLQLFPPMVRGPLPLPSVRRALPGPTLQLRTSSRPVTQPSDGRSFDVLWTTHATAQPQARAWVATESADRRSAQDLQPVETSLPAPPTAFVVPSNPQGQRELFVASALSVEAWYSDGRTQTLPCATPLAGSVDLAVLDIVDDNSADVLALRTDGSLALVQRRLIDGAADWSCIADAPLSGAAWTALIPADFDGDSRPDLLAVSANRDPGVMLWRRGKPALAYPQVLPVHAAAPLHADGGSRPDVLLLLRDGSLHLLTNRFLP